MRSNAMGFIKAGGWTHRCAKDRHDWAGAMAELTVMGRESPARRMCARCGRVESEDPAAWRAWQAENRARRRHARAHPAVKTMPSDAAPGDLVTHASADERRQCHTTITAKTLRRGARFCPCREVVWTRRA